jgi:uncharacterized RDD family membrane protein YckC
MYCSGCGLAILEGARFCAGCGAAAQVAVPATQFCASCGTSIPQAGQFCPKCGQPAARVPAVGAFPMPQVETKYGGFWQRFGARFLDGIIILAIALIPAIIVGVMVYNAAYPSDQLFVTDEQAGDAVEAGILAGIAVCILVSAIYQLVGWSVGGTWGMKALGLRLITPSAGEAPGFGRALMRYFVSLISLNVLWFLGFLWMIWDEKKQTWHDKAAGTVVVAQG